MSGYLLPRSTTGRVRQSTGLLRADDSSFLIPFKNGRKCDRFLRQLLRIPWERYNRSSFQLIKKGLQHVPRSLKDSIIITETISSIFFSIRPQMFFLRRRFAAWEAVKLSEHDPDVNKNDLIQPLCGVGIRNRLLKINRKYSIGV